jgi:hypothetical protein
MNTLFSDMRELDELVVGRQAQLEPRRAQPQAEEGACIYPPFVQFF